MLNQVRQFRMIIICILINFWQLNLRNRIALDSNNLIVKYYELIKLIKLHNFIGDLIQISMARVRQNIDLHKLMSNVNYNIYSLLKHFKVRFGIVWCDPYFSLIM